MLIGQRDRQLRPRGRATRLGAVPAGLPWTLPLRHRSLSFVLCSLKGGHHSLAGVTAASRVQETWAALDPLPSGQPSRDHRAPGRFQGQHCQPRPWPRGVSRFLEGPPK